MTSCGREKRRSPTRGRDHQRCDIFSTNRIALDVGADAIVRFQVQARLQSLIRTEHAGELPVGQAVIVIQPMAHEVTNALRANLR